MRIKNIIIAAGLVLSGCTGLSLTDVVEQPDEGSPLEDVQLAEAVIETSWEVPEEVILGVELLFEVAPETIDPGCAPGEGCFLDPCTGNGDCLSGWCVEHMGETVCSQTCYEECPPGWECVQAGVGADLVYVCVSNHANLCRPCSQSSDCQGTVGVEDVCVDYGAEGNFCGGACGGGQGMSLGIHLQRDLHGRRNHPEPVRGRCR